MHGDKLEYKLKKVVKNFKEIRSLSIVINEYKLNGFEFIKVRPFTFVSSCKYTLKY